MSQSIEILQDSFRLIDRGDVTRLAVAVELDQIEASFSQFEAGAAAILSMPCPPKKMRKAFREFLKAG